MNIEFHKKELLSALDKVKYNIQNKRKPILNPYKISVGILSLIRSLDDGEEQRAKLVAAISDKIRKFHDFYGWMAKGSSDKLGVCSGTIYRSSTYLSINPEKRSGKKSDKDSNVGVHIEHSIPVTTLRNLLIKNCKKTTKPKEIFELLIKYSLCTAFSRVDEQTNINKGHTSSHPDFSDELEFPAPFEVIPYKRYSSDVEIYSMFTGKKVDVKDSLDKLNHYTKSLHIFDWEFIKNNYQGDGQGDGTAI